MELQFHPRMGWVAPVFAPLKLFSYEVQVRTSTVQDKTLCVPEPFEGRASRLRTYQYWCGSVSRLMIDFIRGWKLLRCETPCVRKRSIENESECPSGRRVGFEGTSTTCTRTGIKSNQSCEWVWHHNSFLESNQICRTLASTAFRAQTSNRSDVCTPISFFSF